MTYSNIFLTRLAAQGQLVRSKQRSAGKPLTGDEMMCVQDSEDGFTYTGVFGRAHWDLAQKKVLLGKAFDALPKGGAVIVYDAIIDNDRRENAFGLLMSLNMLIETSGGFDYTGEDRQGWMREAGFSKTRVEPLVGPDSMVIGLK